MRGGGPAPTDLRPSPAAPPYQKKRRMFLSITKGRSPKAPPRERIRPAQGHRAGVLRGLIQDPGSGLPRIPIPRTWVNRLTGWGSHAALLTLRARSLRQVFREIHREFIALI